MTSVTPDSSAASLSVSDSDSNKQIVWPNQKEDYDLLDVVGSGATSVVQVALCKPLDQKVAIKRIDLERCGTSIEELQKEISLMSSCNHPNIVNYYTSFVVKAELWLVMRLMAGGSLLDIIKHVLSKSPKGGVLDEVVIATVLKEVLQGLDYLHSNTQIHRDMKAGNILVGEDGSVQLADFGVSNWLYDSHLVPEKRSKKAPRMTFVGTPCWMAPEVMDQSVGYDEKADIWSFGITALELATGTAPYAKFPPMKVLMLTLENPPPTLETCGDLNGEEYRKNYSKNFQKMVEKCLQRDPAKRPAASELLKSPFFKKAKDKEFLKDVILGDAPSLQSRAKKVRRVAGSSGHLKKDDQGTWVWSDDDLDEESSSNELSVPNQSGTVSTPTTSENVSSSSSISQPAPIPVPEIAVQPPRALASPEMTALLQQRQNIEAQKNQVESQLIQAKQHQQSLLQQQASGQVTQEQQMAALKTVQTLERHRQNYMFQLQQVELNVQQLQDALAMEEQFQAMKVQQKPPVESGQPIKLALRKRLEKNPKRSPTMSVPERTNQNQLKDIKFDFVPGKDASDVIAKDLVAAGLIEGKNLVVVAANINKIVENPAIEKVNFQLVTDLPQDQLDEKKLIGFAQVTVVQD